MLVSNFTAALNQIAPLQYAEAWDNVGLLIGDPHQPVTRVMLCIDYSTAVAAEAREAECDFIIAYHPPMFDAVKKITADGPSSLIHDAIGRGIAIYSPHTSLDVAPGGTNDMLADAVGILNPAPLRANAAKATEYKLITFVPEKSLQQVSEALFAAGAGQIGNYSQCSFRSAGHGTFFGQDGSNPITGKTGQLETAPEIRLETIVPIARVSEVIHALRQTHPYEEPAFDLLTLAAGPSSLGMGRVGSLPVPTPLPQLLNRIKQELDLDHLLVAESGKDRVTRVAVCAGSCGNLLDAAITACADFYLTGEMRHHDAIKAIRAGITVVCTLHSNSERAVLKRVKARLEQILPDHPQILLSQTDRDPFAVR
jgi:dinuclear metal center YbgI/SA1388 family protein